MGISYFNQAPDDEQEYVVNFFRMKKMKGKFLVVADHGSWAILNKKELHDLMTQRIGSKLFHLLEKMGIIITKNNLDKITSAYQKRNSFLFKGASLHILVPTLRCNHCCIYCHSSAKSADSKEYDMSISTVEKILSFIFQTPSDRITIEFQGGDSLLNIEAFKHTVLKAKEMNQKFKKRIKFALVTNLTLMSDELLDWISKERISLCTSLDGPKEVHDKNRKYEDGNPTYEDVVKKIKRVTKGKEYPLAALMVTTRYSLPFWKEIIDEYVKLGFTTIQLKYINKLGYADKTWKKIGYTSDEFIRFWKKSLDYLIRLNKRGVRIRCRQTAIILSKILTEFDPSYLDLRSPCGIVMGQLAYDYNGDIYSCDEGRNFELFKLGNVESMTYKQLFGSENAVNLISSSINDNYLCDICAYKTYCGVCPVISYAEQNTIIPRLASFSKCRINKAMFDYIFHKLAFDKDARAIFYSWVEDWKENSKTKKVQKAMK